MRLKRQTSIYLRPEQLEALRQVAHETEIPMAALIRRGVDMVLQSHTGFVPLKRKATHATTVSTSRHPNPA